MNGPGSFAYLNKALSWEGFVLTNLAVGASGELTLARTPVVTGAIGSADLLPPAPAVPGPAGIAVTSGCDCDIFISDPARNLIWRLATCEDEPAPMPFLSGSGSSPGQLDRPRGLAIVNGPAGPRLYVADSANHRIQVFDVATQQPLAVWGQPDPYGPPAPGSDEGRLDDPWGLAADRAGNVYVVDHGNVRIQRFTPGGVTDHAFAQRIAAGTVPLGEPLAIAINEAGDEERLFVLERRDGITRVRSIATNSEGTLDDGWAVDDGADATAVGSAGDVLFIAKANGILLEYGVDGACRSRMTTGLPSLTALTAGCHGELLAGGGGLPVLRLAVDGGFVERGSFQAGPFVSTARPIAWRRLRAELDALATGAHFQLFTYSASVGTPPLPPADPASPFAGNGWYSQPVDVDDVLVLDAQARQVLSAGPPANPQDDQEQPLADSYTWIGGTFWGDGASSPVLRQLRLDFAPITAAKYLPAVYRDGPQRRLLTELVMAAVASETARPAQLFASLAALFQPMAAPGEWLPWLASWLDFDLIDDWPEVETRANIAGAMQLQSLRGTVEGLRAYIKTYTGLDARIVEPIAGFALFALDENTSLGFNTVVAAAHEQGAVLGSTATLGQSHVITSEEAGVPLFSDIVNRFAVEVYGAQMAEPRTRQLLDTVLDREHPAHTGYHVCVIEPRMRVGMQARLGLDSIVAGPEPDLRLGDATELGADTVLANRPLRSRRLGAGARVGGVI